MKLMVNIIIQFSHICAGFLKILTSIPAAKPFCRSDFVLHESHVEFLAMGAGTVVYKREAL